MKVPKEIMDAVVRHVWGHVGIRLFRNDEERAWLEPLIERVGVEGYEFWACQALLEQVKWAAWLNQVEHQVVLYVRAKGLSAPERQRLQEYYSAVQAVLQEQIKRYEATV